jgi:hypothetical protein
MKSFELLDVEAAYIAGLLDGEGSFNIGKHYTKGCHAAKRGFVWEIRVSVGMTETQGLEVIKCVTQKKRLRVSPGRKHRTMYYITLFSNEIRAMLPKLLPYLRVKKEQAELLLEAVSIIKPRGDALMDEKLESLRQQISTLNNPSRSLRGGAAYKEKHHG